MPSRRGKKAPVLGAVIELIRGNPALTKKQVASRLKRPVSSSTFARARKELRDGTGAVATEVPADPTEAIRRRHRDLVADLVRRVMIELEAL